MLNFIGAVTLAVPFALAVAAADLSRRRVLPAPPDLARLRAAHQRFMVRHIPDEPLPTPTKEPCLDAHDCRAPVPPSLQPAPAGKH